MTSRTRQSTPEAVRSGPREAWSPGPSGSMRASVGEGTPATANGDTSMEASSPGMGLDDSFKGSPGASPLKGDDDGTRVQVICRVRPLIQYEIAGGSMMTVTTTGNTQVVVTQRSATRKFSFSGVYGPASKQSALYDDCVRPMMDAVLEGYNATILAYGQSGSGKTYTMGTGQVIGEVPPQDLGILPRVVMELFRCKAEPIPDKFDSLSLSCTFVEIYNEEFRDLLAVALEGPRPRAPITMREEQGSVVLHGVLETKADSLPDMMAAFENGLRARTVGSTNLNVHSSRSHAIFTVIVRLVLKGTVTESKLHLVDLAGSERIKRTNATGARAKEGININKGLLVLGAVIEALSSKKASHVPYRDSKLTRVLQDSLGGSSRTLFIACVSCADVNTDESLNTLKYAVRAAAIKNKPKRNLAEMMGSEEFRLKMKNLEQFLENDGMRDGTIPDLEAFGADVLWATLVRLHYKSEGKGMSGKSEEALTKELEGLRAEIERMKKEHVEAIDRLEKKARMAEMLLQVRDTALRNMMTELRGLSASRRIPQSVLTRVEDAMKRQDSELPNRWQGLLMRQMAQNMLDGVAAPGSQGPDVDGRDLPTWNNTTTRAPMPFLARSTSAFPGLALARTNSQRSQGSKFLAVVRAATQAARDGTAAEGVGAGDRTDVTASRASLSSSMHEADGGVSMLTRDASRSLRTLQQGGPGSYDAVVQAMRLGMRYPSRSPSAGNSRRGDLVARRSVSSVGMGALVSDLAAEALATPQVPSLAATPGPGASIRHSRQPSRDASVKMSSGRSSAFAASDPRGARAAGSAGAAWQGGVETAGVARGAPGGQGARASLFRGGAGAGEAAEEGSEAGASARQTGTGDGGELPALTDFSDRDVHLIRKIQALARARSREVRRSLQGVFASETPSLSRGVGAAGDGVTVGDRAPASARGPGEAASARGGDEGSGSAVERAAPVLSGIGGRRASVDSGRAAAGAARVPGVITAPRWRRVGDAGVQAGAGAEGGVTAGGGDGAGAADFAGEGGAVREHANGAVEGADKMVFTEGDKGDGSPQRAERAGTGAGLASAAVAGREAANGIETESEAEAGSEPGAGHAAAPRMGGMEAGAGPAERIVAASMTVADKPAARLDAKPLPAKAPSSVSGSSTSLLSSLQRRLLGSSHDPAPSSTFLSAFGSLLSGWGRAASVASARSDASASPAPSVVGAPSGVARKGSMAESDWSEVNGGLAAEGEVGKGSGGGSGVVRSLAGAGAGSRFRESGLPGRAGEAGSGPHADGGARRGSGEATGGDAAASVSETGRAEAGSAAVGMAERASGEGVDTGVAGKPDEGLRSLPAAASGGEAVRVAKAGSQGRWVMPSEHDSSRHSASEGAEADGTVVTTREGEGGVSVAGIGGDVVLSSEEDEVEGNDERLTKTAPGQVGARKTRGAGAGAGARWGEGGRSSAGVHESAGPASSVLPRPLDREKERDVSFGSFGSIGDGALRTAAAERYRVDMAARGDDGPETGDVGRGNAARWGKGTRGNERGERGAERDAEGASGAAAAAGAEAKAETGAWQDLPMPEDPGASESPTLLRRVARGGGGALAAAVPRPGRSPGPSRRDGVDEASDTGIDTGDADQSGASHAGTVIRRTSGASTAGVTAPATATDGPSKAPSGGFGTGTGAGSGSEWGDGGSNAGLYAGGSRDAEGPMGFVRPPPVANLKALVHIKSEPVPANVIEEELAGMGLGAAQGLDATSRGGGSTMEGGAGASSAGVSRRDMLKRARGSSQRQMLDKGGMLGDMAGMTWKSWGGRAGGGGEWGNVGAGVWGSAGAGAGALRQGRRGPAWAEGLLEEGEEEGEVTQRGEGRGGLWADGAGASAGAGAGANGGAGTGRSAVAGAGGSGNADAARQSLSPSPDELRRLASTVVPRLAERAERIIRGEGSGAVDAASDLAEMRDDLEKLATALGPTEASSEVRARLERVKTALGQAQAVPRELHASLLHTHQENMESLIEALYALAEAPASGGEGHERAAFGAAGRVVSRRELMFQPFSAIPDNSGAPDGPMSQDLSSLVSAVTALSRGARQARGAWGAHLGMVLSGERRGEAVSTGVLTPNGGMGGMDSGEESGTETSGNDTPGPMPVMAHKRVSEGMGRAGWARDMSRQTSERLMKVYRRAESLRLSAPNSAGPGWLGPLSASTESLPAQGGKDMRIQLLASRVRETINPGATGSRAHAGTEPTSPLLNGRGGSGEFTTASGGFGTGAFSASLPLATSSMTREGTGSTGRLSRERSVSPGAAGVGDGGAPDPSIVMAIQEAYRLGRRDASRRGLRGNSRRPDRADSLSGRNTLPSMRSGSPGRTSEAGSAAQGSVDGRVPLDRRRVASVADGRMLLHGERSSSGSIRRIGSSSTLSPNAGLGRRSLDRVQDRVARWAGGAEGGGSPGAGEGGESDDGAVSRKLDEIRTALRGSLSRRRVDRGAVDDDGDPAAVMEPDSAAGSEAGGPGRGFHAAARRAMAGVWEPSRGQGLGSQDMETRGMHDVMGSGALSDALAGPAELPSDSDARPSKRWAARADSRRKAM